ncbi:hypothetical protein UCRPC4_g06371 [Phaeomoniella chlamydospora]|uniref:Uncharacterized protein n=1 Tax=Phaeomoniella chlamydospora TaxID=158046 RepID=A0A0G2DWV5_PHACM|nr:hypothetical protein UCRPC4_g06371 [Phaeomoniella chlamydospora]
MESQAHNRIFYFERGELSYTDRAEGGLNPFYESCDHLLTQYDDGKPTFRELVYAWKLATGHESEVFRSFVINILYFILVEDIKDNSGLFDSLEKLDADALGLWDVFEETATFRERRSTISLWEWNGKKIQTHLEEAVKEQHCIRRPPQDETFEHEAEDDNECHLSL